MRERQLKSKTQKSGQSVCERQAERERELAGAGVRVVAQIASAPKIRQQIYM